MFYTKCSEIIPFPRPSHPTRAYPAKQSRRRRRTPERGQAWSGPCKRHHDLDEGQEVVRGVGARRGASVHTSRSARSLGFKHATKPHKGSSLRSSGAPQTAMRVNPAKGCKEVDVGVALRTRFQSKRSRQRQKESTELLLANYGSLTAPL